ncbi:MAG TPA: hypothetical protein VMW17_17715 [Candidatus Binatia bacterium]|nr:hypothetical protein [Candidatus Binatia bacterium]
MSSFAAITLCPDVLLPEQYFAAPRPLYLSPERRLMLAVLEEAVLTLLKHRGSATRRGDRLVRETERWICAGEAPWPFAFVNICAALHLDADYVRNGLLTLVRSPNDERPPVSLPFARRVAGRRHRVGLIQPHRKVAS